MTKSKSKLRWAAGLTAVVLALGMTLATVGCATKNAYFDPAKTHHRASGFSNNYGPQVDESLSRLLRWQIEAYKSGSPKAPSQVYAGYDQFPIVKPDLAFLQANKSQITATWIGHATVLLQLGGLNILTDPVFSDRVSPVSFAGPKRKVALPVQLAQLPRIDLVLISHNHYDHLDQATVRQLKEQPGGEPLFIAPLGIDLWLKNEGLTRVERFDWWDEKNLLGLKVTFVPAQHWSSRTAFDRNASLWGGWVLEHGGFKSYFAGDTGISKDFLDMRAKFGGFDLSFIPVGAYEPRWFMQSQHVNPQEAVQIHNDVQSKFSIGIHWGTFELTDEALDQPLIDLPIALKAAKVPENNFVMLKHGETRVFN